jgi:hypothetical protein
VQHSNRPPATRHETTAPSPGRPLNSR